MLDKTLHYFVDVIQTCKNMKEAEIFNPNLGCKLCMANILNPKHPTSQNHRRRIICVKLFMLLDEILQPIPNTEKLLTNLSKIYDLLRTQGSDSYLLNTDRSYWCDIYIAGDHESRANGKPDGGKIWFKRFLDDLSFKIKSMKEANEDHRLSELVTNIETIISELTQGKKRKSSQGCKQVRLCRNDVRPHTIFHFPFARQC